MIQDIQPHCFRNEYVPMDPGGDDVVFVFQGKQMLAKKEQDRLICPVYKQVTGDVQYLFSIDDVQYFLASETQEIPGFSWYETKVLRRTGPKHLQFSGMTAWHLYTWYTKNQYCGRCGGTLNHSVTERALTCLKCGNVVYPVIAPAVIVGVIHKDTLLMTRYAHRAYKGHALIAGFCEIGETPEETVEREVMEEVGLKVKHIRYYKSQPWGFDANLLMGFYCDLDGDPTITLEEEELARARFISRDAIIDEYEDLSLTNEMIVAFKNGKVPQ